MDSIPGTFDNLPQPRRGLSPATVAGVLRRLGGDLIRSRLLLGYLLLGLASGLAGSRGEFFPTLFNYLVLMPLYVTLIFLWSRNDPPLAASRGAETGKSRRDVVLVALLFLANLGATSWFWAGGPPSQVMGSVQSTLRGAGWDRSLANVVANGVESTLFSLVPALAVVFLLFRFRPSQVGLVPRRLDLGLALVALSIAMAYLLKLAFGITPPPLLKGPEFLPLAIALFFAQAFVNGLPEEFIFRGAMFSRLVPWFRNPHHVLVLTSMLFVAMHIPSHIAQPTGAPWWTLIPFSPGSQPTGLIWGYLFYRTRSIWPGVLWHTCWGPLGIVFLG